MSENDRSGWNLHRATRRFAHFLPLKWLGVAALVLIPGAIRAGEARPEADDAPTPPPEGVTREVELTILRGLKFLVESQKADGSWNAPNDEYPVAMTALAGLALLASGS